MNKCITFFGDNPLDDEKLRTVVHEVSGACGHVPTRPLSGLSYPRVLVVLLAQVGESVDPEKTGYLAFDKLVPALCDHHIIEDYVVIVPDRMSIA